MANGVTYGFIGLEAMFASRVLEVGQELVNTAIQATTDEYKRQSEAMTSVWAMPSNTIQELVLLPGSGVMQDIDEWGNPLPTKDGASYTAGYPLKLAADAWAVSRLAKPKMTVEEVNRRLLATLRKDTAWLRLRMLQAVFTNTNRTFTDPQVGDVTVLPLANGDGTTYMIEGTDAPATDNHYLASASAIADNANHYVTIYDELIEHPSNSGEVVAYIASSLRQTTLDLTDFVPIQDSSVILGADSDRVRNLGESELARIQGPGNEVLGRVGKMWIVEWKALPAGYIIAVDIGNIRPFLNMRQDDEPSLQGLFRETFSVDGARAEYRFLRYAGFGVHDRTAAVVFRVGNASYAIPTGYTATA